MGSPELFWIRAGLCDHMEVASRRIIQNQVWPGVARDAVTNRT